jgi:hypothetical protein
MITDDDLQQRGPLPEYRAAGRVSAVIEELSGREMRALDLDDAQIATLRAYGPLALTLSSATKLAPGLGGSVD